VFDAVLLDLHLDLEEVLAELCHGAEQGMSSCAGEAANEKSEPERSVLVEIALKRTESRQSLKEAVAHCNMLLRSGLGRGCPLIQPQLAVRSYTTPRRGCHLVLQARVCPRPGRRRPPHIEEHGGGLRVCHVKEQRVDAVGARRCSNAAPEVVGAAREVGGANPSQHDAGPAGQPGRVVAHRQACALGAPAALLMVLRGHWLMCVPPGQKLPARHGWHAPSLSASKNPMRQVQSASPAERDSEELLVRQVEGAPAPA